MHNKLLHTAYWFYLSIIGSIQRKRDMSVVDYDCLAHFPNGAILYYREVMKVVPLVAEILKV